jgi:hypothetical protein
MHAATTKAAGERTDRAVADGGAAVQNFGRELEAMREQVRLGGVKPAETRRSSWGDR